MDKRLIFRYRPWTTKSFTGAGCAKSSVVLEIRRLSAQAAVLRGRPPRRGKAQAIRRTLCLQEKPVKGCQGRPYRKPTLVAGHKYAKVDE